MAAKVDDDVPLASLMKSQARPSSASSAAPKAKAQKIDDDTPLALLVNKTQAKPGRPSSGGAAAPKAGGVAAKGRGKGGRGAPGRGAAKRKGGDDSSSSSSSSSDSSDSSSDSRVVAKAKKKAVATAKGAKRKVLQKAKPPPGPGGGGDAEEDTGMGGEEVASRRKDRTLKEQVVAELLCRWWYVMDDWPPDDDAYYDAELRKKSCRRVSIDDWEWVPEVDKEGLRKVYALSQYRGCFRSHDGDLIDVRPKDTCPCYNNYMTKSVLELYSWLVKAYENQIAELRKAEGVETPLELELKARLSRSRVKLQEVRESTDPSLRRASGA